MKPEADILDLKKDEFDKVWAIITEIGAQERHFNGLQSQYRALASTWLLAVFGGCGFILKEETIQNKELLIAGIGLAGSIGIFLLWVLDVLVYHKLLHSCFVTGQELEKKYAWLPKMRNTMMKTQNNKGVLPRVVWFYISGVIIPLMIGSGSLCLWSRDYRQEITVPLMLISIMAMFGVSLYMYTKSAGEKQDCR